MSDYDLCCDESKDKNGRRYLAYGGILLPRVRTTRFCESIDRWCDSVGWRGELKWGKTKAHTVDRMCTFALGSFHYINKGPLRFASAVFDLQERKYHVDQPPHDDAILRAYKFVLNGFALNLAKSDRLFIYPDDEFLDCIPEKFVAMLNRGIEEHKRWSNVRIVRTFEPRKSEDHRLIQMADVITGAIAAANHQDYTPTSKSGAAKERLIQRVVKLGGHSLTKDTPPTSRRFKIWFPPMAQKRSAGIPTSLEKPRVRPGPATP
jgi:hypothetical protein